MLKRFFVVVATLSIVGCAQGQYQPVYPYYPAQSTYNPYGYYDHHQPPPVAVIVTPEVPNYSSCDFYYRQNNSPMYPQCVAQVRRDTDARNRRRFEDAQRFYPR
jgi:hypothetical protein